jgi:hypothetical protein
MEYSYPQHFDSNTVVCNGARNTLFAAAETRGRAFTFIEWSAKYALVTEHTEHIDDKSSSLDIRDS